MVFALISEGQNCHRAGNFVEVVSDLQVLIFFFERWIPSKNWNEKSGEMKKMWSIMEGTELIARRWHLLGRPGTQVT